MLTGSIEAIGRDCVTISTEGWITLAGQTVVWPHGKGQYCDPQGGVDIGRLRSAGGSAEVSILLACRLTGIWVIDSRALAHP
jgi:hypothetical protein